MADTSPSTTVSDTLIDGIKLVFSSFVLMAISVIIGGKLLGNNLMLPVGDADDDFFDIRIPYLFRLRGTKSQVILGFTAFVITLVVVGFGGGKSVYESFKNNFGLDPGQWLSICTVSAFLTVIWTSLVYVVLLLRLGTGVRNATADSIIQELGKKGPGSKIDLPEKTDLEPPPDSKQSEPVSEGH